MNYIFQLTYNICVQYHIITYAQDCHLKYLGTHLVLEYYNIIIGCLAFLLNIKGFLLVFALFMF